MPGISLNPGGLTHAHRELRSAFLARVPLALEKVDAWLESGDFESQRAAVETVLTRGLGKPAKASELPSTSPSPQVAPEQADTSSMLGEVRQMLAKGIAVLKRQQEEGELGADGLVSLGKLGHSLGEVLKAEKEAARMSKLSALSVDELLAVVFQHVPDDVLRAALAKRESEQKESAS